MTTPPDHGLRVLETDQTVPPRPEEEVADGGRPPEPADVVRQGGPAAGDSEHVGTAEDLAARRRAVEARAVDLELVEKRRGRLVGARDQHRRVVEAER